MERQKVSDRYILISAITVYGFAILSTIGIGVSLAHALPENSASRQFAWLLTASSFFFITFFAFVAHHFSSKHSKSRASLEQQGQIDETSGVFSRSRLLTDLERETRSASRRNASLSICMVQIENLMSINQELGRDAGDRLLYAIGLAAKSALRDTDYFGRVSGLQFCAVFPNTGGTAATIATQRLSDAIKEIRHSSVRGEISVEAKVGFAEMTPGDTADRLIQKATDQLLAI